MVTLHQAQAYPEEAILAALAQYDVSLIVVNASGETAETSESGSDRIVGHVTRAVIERSGSPVLLLPRLYREAIPWERALVPLSAEVEADDALALAVRLANVLDLEWCG